METIQLAQSNPLPRSCNAQYLAHHQSSQLQSLPQPLHRNALHFSLSRYLWQNQSQWLFPQSYSLCPLPKFIGCHWNPLGGADSPDIKPLLPQTFNPSLNPLWHDPRLQYIFAEAVSQLVIQEHPNHIYYLVTVQPKNYDKLKLLHPKCWTTIMSNELVWLDSGVGYIMKSGTETFLNP